jgi:hypothetical protein
MKQPYVSRYPGVVWLEGRWLATTVRRGRGFVVLGSYETQEAAAAVVRASLVPAKKQRHLVRQRATIPESPQPEPQRRVLVRVGNITVAARTAPTPKQEANFGRRVQRPEGPLGKWGCWTWTGQTDKAKVLKYGRFTYSSQGRRRSVRAHRMMWELVNGPIANGLFVLHKCDNPLCVRPEHLYLGTALDNTWDMLTRGRARGTLAPHGKLTEADVAEIRRIWAARLEASPKRHGVYPTMKEIAAVYGVSGPMIHHVVHHKWWKAVPVKAA